jgi:DNA-binding transcriptional MerR regulator
MPGEVVIPDKDEFKIGEVCEITGVKPFVLRYWEQEFSELAPVKGMGGQRTYTRADVDLILHIKRLLYEERFTVAGAKKRLSEEAAKVVVAPGARLDSSSSGQVESYRRVLRQTRRELEALVKQLK